MTRPFMFTLTLLIVAAMVSPAAAQTPADPPPAAAAAAAQDDDPDRDPNDSQPDFYVATLNTNLRLPKGKLNFRLTHRFTTPLGEGDFGDLAGRLFGLDGGALIGLDLKYGLFPRLRHRHLSHLLRSHHPAQGRYNLIRDGNGPFGLSLVANVDGTDNFTDEYSPGVGVVLSRELGDRGAIYFQPSYVGNSNLIDDDDDDDYTVMAGLGARLRLGRNSYLFAEGSPRVAGFDPGVDHDQLRLRAALRRPRVPVELLERLRHHAGAGCAQRRGQRQLVPGLQPHEEILLMRTYRSLSRSGRGSCSSR